MSQNSTPQNLVDQIVAAVLYEGYLLYPYRQSSTKNRQRWTFGGVLPAAYAETHTGERSSIRTECLVTGAAVDVEVSLRALQLIERSLEKTTPGGPVVAGELHDGLRRLLPGQEATDRAITLRVNTQDETRHALPFTMPASRIREPVHDRSGFSAGDIGAVIREQYEVSGELRATVDRLATDLHRITVEVQNHTPVADAASLSREAALRHALLSAHVVLTAAGGQFVSLLDPPPELQAAAAACRNEGVWPVLVGAPGEAGTMLASPIILYDYPQIAAESPGDLFDATEIDEILSLRILTMTDAERAEAACDDRARAMLERTAAMSAPQMQSLHGVWRQTGGAS